MKVALLSDCYPPRLGGIETQVRDLGRELSAAGHEVEVFTATLGPAGERRGHVEVDRGVTVHREALRLPFDLPVNPWARRAIRRHLRTGGFDVAHVHMGVVSPFATAQAHVCTSLGLPTAVTWHCVLSDPAIAVLARRGHAKRWAGAGAALSAVSSMAAARVGRIAGGAPVAVLPNGIDVAAWRSRAVAGDGAIRIVTALRFAPRKRVPALLALLRGVRARVPGDIRLEATVFGDGPLRTLAERLLRADERTWITLAGRVPRTELARAYAAADIYLSPTRLESFGIAALEARTAGLAVVADARSGVADFVTDGVEGLLGASDEALADAVTRLATDASLRHRIREHNALIPPAQDWPAVVAQVEAEYARAVAGVRP